MADAGPNYAVERRRTEIQISEHRSTVEKGRSRLAEIGRQKELNTARAELANLELDDEARKVAENESALMERIAEIEKNLKAMVKGGQSDG